MASATTTNSLRITEFVAPAGNVYSDFVSACNEYCDYNFPKMVHEASRALVVIPAVFSFKFAEPNNSGASGSAIKLSTGTKANLEGDLAEQIVFEALEKFGLANEGTFMLLFRAFTIDNRKAKIVSAIWPELNSFRLEVDFILFHEVLGVIVFEVKARKEYKQARFAEASHQLENVENFLYSLYQSVHGTLFNWPILKVVCYPFMNELPESAQARAGVTILFKEESQDYSSTVHHFLTTMPVSKVKRSKTQLIQMAKNIIGIHAMTVSSNKSGASLNDDISVSHFLHEESQRISQYRVADPSKKLESKLIRTTKSAKVLQTHLSIYFMTPQQLRVWSTNQQIIVGPAGTGKTILIMGKAIELASRDENVIVLAPVPASTMYKQCLSSLTLDIQKNVVVLSCEEFSENLPSIAELYHFTMQALMQFFKQCFESWQDGFVGTLAGWRLMRKMSAARMAGQQRNRDDTQMPHIEQWKQSLELQEMFANLFFEDPEQQAASGGQTSIPLPILQSFLESFTLEPFASLLHQVHKDLSSLTGGKHLLIDDFFTLNDRGLWITLSLVLGKSVEHYFPPPFCCWIALDPMQLFLDDTLSKFFLLLNSNMAAILKTSIKESNEKQIDEDHFVETCAKGMILHAMHQLWVEVKHLSVFQVLQMQYLNSILRSTVKVLDHWKDIYSFALSNTELVSHAQLRKESLAPGHGFIGAQTVVVSLRNEKLLEITDGNSIFLSRNFADRIGVTITALLGHANDTQHSLSLNDFAILFDSKEMAVFLDCLKQTLAEKFSLPCSTIQEQFATKAIAIDYTKNSVSCEWAVVFCIGTLSGMDALIRVEPYIASSRCKAKLFVFKRELISIVTSDVVEAKQPMVEVSLA